MSGENQPKWVAGFMSGTSLDAVDGALILTDGVEVFDFGPAVERKYTASERQILQDATEAARAWNWSGPQPEKAFAPAREVMSKVHAEAYARLIEGWSGGAPSHMGVHGQTVLHRARAASSIGATLQLLDADDLAKRTGVPVIYDFRSDDVAAGGQGAPLAPAYHGALMQKLGGGRAVMLNLGGVANISAALPNGTLLAFDTGPANGPMDEWVEGHDRGTHDIDGGYAASGHVHEGLLAQLFEHPWFNQKPPKSLDRYDFNASMARGLTFEDGAATLTAFSARAVAAGLAHLPYVPDRVIACGGGRHNPVLMEMLAKALPCALVRAEQVGLRGDSIEAEAFAFLAARHVHGLPISWPGTTGVSQPMTGGRIALPAL